MRTRCAFILIKFDVLQDLEDTNKQTDRRKISMTNVFVIPVFRANSKEHGPDARRVQFFADPTYLTLGTKNGQGKDYAPGLIKSIKDMMEGIKENATFLLMHTSGYKNEGCGLMGIVELDLDREIVDGSTERGLAKLRAKYSGELLDQCGNLTDELMIPIRTVEGTRICPVPKKWCRDLRGPIPTKQGPIESKKITLTDVQSLKEMVR